jgi:hypothetical protein
MSYTAKIPSGSISQDAPQATSLMRATLTSFWSPINGFL